MMNITTIDYYLRASALIYPSKNEGFGFPPLEAMTFGCPVISSNNAAITEATGLDKFIFNPDDASEMINVIERVIESKDNRIFFQTYL